VRGIEILRTSPFGDSPNFGEVHIPHSTGPVRLRFLCRIMAPPKVGPSDGPQALLGLAFPEETLDNKTGEGSKKGSNNGC
jgi:hypothetical protein